MRRRGFKARGPAAILLALISVVTALVTRPWERPRRSSPPPGDLPATGVVEKAVDGDTLHVEANGWRYTVRLIGVDTPEAHPSEKLERDAKRSAQDRETIMTLGRRAAELTRQLCDGKSCRLEYDQANAASHHRDKYERVLAYVWVRGDQGQEVFVNEELIRRGYARALTAYPYDEKVKERFRRLDREARERKRGLWREWQ
jgi:micrococcal nuclease